MSGSLRFLPSLLLNPLRFPPINHRRRISSSALPPTRSELSFTVGTHLIPHPAKVGTGGDDAFFVSSRSGGVLAVADGVSGWAERGVNPALFSRELMANASNLVADEEVLLLFMARIAIYKGILKTAYPFSAFEISVGKGWVAHKLVDRLGIISISSFPQTNCDPQTLLMKAHASTSSIGSATVIIAKLDNGILNIANVGDCGLRIIRKGQVMFSTRPQEHYFNCPYQLSSEKATQTYHDAMVYSVKLLEGDTVVMGSDGLFDNVFDHEIVTIISQFKDVVEAAKRLADLASTHSTDVNFDSPYSVEARSLGLDLPLWRKILGRKLTGGKLDDITVILGHVLSS